MRGFVWTVVALSALDVVLSAPASRVATLLNRPTHWLAAWMDAGQPLIPQGALVTSTAGPAGSTKIPGSDAVKPTMPGHCPPGYLWAPDKRVCLRELG